MESKTLAQALLAAQKEMGNAIKGSSNPFFRSKYADLNAVREACMPILNTHGIAVLQPTIVFEGKNYVKTLLLHESGDSMECLTEILYKVAGDAQGQGSGISYARRYGLQSFVNIGADDDDGNKASLPKQAEPQAQKDVMADWVKSINGCKTENDLQALWHGSGLTTSTAGAALIALFDRRKKEINGTK